MLSVLYFQRRANPYSPDISFVEIEERLGFPREYLEFTVWYLKSKGYITRTDSSDFTLTADGVDFVETQRVNLPVLNKLLTKGSDSPAGLGDSQTTSAQSPQAILLPPPLRPGLQRHEPRRSMFGWVHVLSACLHTWHLALMRLRVTFFDLLFPEFINQTYRRAGITLAIVEEKSAHVIHGYPHSWVRGEREIDAASSTKPETFGMFFELFATIFEDSLLLVVDDSTSTGAEKCIGKVRISRRHG